jgi:hypothetical protein
VSTWLGISILTLFSLGLTLFMRFGARTSQRNTPRDLGRWVKLEGAEGEAETYVERRLLQPEGGLFRRSRLVEQRRRRRVSDGEIVEIMPERYVDG